MWKFRILPPVHIKVLMAVALMMRSACKTIFSTCLSSARTHLVFIKRMGDVWNCQTINSKLNAIAIAGSACSQPNCDYF